MHPTLLSLYTSLTCTTPARCTTSSNNTDIYCFSSAWYRFLSSLYVFKHYDENCRFKNHRIVIESLALILCRNLTQVIPCFPMEAPAATIISERCSVYSRNQSIT